MTTTEAMKVEAQLASSSTAAFLTVTIAYAARLQVQGAPLSRMLTLRIKRELGLRTNYRRSQIRTLEGRNYLCQIRLLRRRRLLLR